MKGDCIKSLNKLCLGLTLCCLLVSNAIANVIDAVKYDELFIDFTAKSNVSESQHVSPNSITQTTETLHKDYASNDFIEKNGKLFFEMRDEQVLISEYSAMTLFLLGFMALFLRRWR